MVQETNPKQRLLRSVQTSEKVVPSDSCMQRRRVTNTALQPLAASCCDSPLILDELTQVDPRAAGELAYLLSNGPARARIART